jgi:cytochrome c biogenesis protein CcdA
VLEISYLAALFGGMLSLLSPCSALLLPAFFAYVFQPHKALLAKTAVFYLGFAATLVPLGMGVSAVSRLVYGERSTLITVSGLVIISLGVLQILGRGFDLGPLSRWRGGSEQNRRARPSPSARSTGSPASAPVPSSARS